LILVLGISIIETSIKLIQDVKNEKIYECGGKDTIGKQTQNGI
jgi:hypothetical protein